MAGYSAAPISLDFKACCSSRSSARRSSTKPRLPLCSPAPMTATKIAENSAGCCPSARAKVEPPLTSALRVATKWRSGSVWASSDKLLSARSSGKPEDTSPANWRVHTPSPVALNTRRLKILSPCPELALLPALSGTAIEPEGAPSASTLSGTKACPRNNPRAPLAESASITPLRSFPSEVSASNE